MVSVFLTRGPPVNQATQQKFRQKKHLPEHKTGSELSSRDKYKQFSFDFVREKIYNVPYFGVWSDKTSVVSFFLTSGPPLNQATQQNLSQKNIGLGIKPVQS